MPRTEVDQEVIARIALIGRDRMPIEAAGFIFQGSHVIELANRSMMPTKNFEFEPEDVLIAVEMAHLELTDDDWHDAVLWHTHPAGNIGPSSTDIENKLGPIRHLVVALTDAGPIPTYY